MLAHNPRKRRAEDDLLQAQTKYPRTSSDTAELPARWAGVSKELMGLFYDTSAALFGAMRDVLTSVIHQDSDTLPIAAPPPRPDYPISPPPSPPKPTQQSAPPRSTTQVENKSLPTPPLSDAQSDGSSNEAGPSNPSRPAAEKPPPPRRHISDHGASSSKQATRSALEEYPDPPLPTPPPSEPSASSLSPTTAFLGLYPQVDQALAAALRKPSKPKPTTKKIKHREHIFHKQFKAGVKDQMQRTREEMEKDLYLTRRRAGHFRSSFTAFQQWLGYRERLELLQKLEDLKPSPSLEDLRDVEHLYPPIARSQSNPVPPVNPIHRAFKKADLSLRSPKPVVHTPLLSRLRATLDQQSAEIDARIRPRRPSLPESLPAQDEAEVDELLRKKGVISKCVREQVGDHDLMKLRPGQWLNDEIINFYGQMLICRADEGKENRDAGLLDIHYFSTFFWTKLKDVGYEKGRLAKWTKKFDLFSKDIILIPVNHNNSHWTCAAINFRKKRIESYDSMNMDRTSVYKHLRAYLDAEHRNKKKQPFDFEGWVDWNLEDTPQQENGYDCGVFTCQFLESLSRGEESFAFTQENMPYLRRRMIWEIGHTRLRVDS